MQAREEGKGREGRVLTREGCVRLEGRREGGEGREGSTSPNRSTSLCISTGLL